MSVLEGHLKKETPRKSGRFFFWSSRHCGTLVRAYLFASLTAWSFLPRRFLLAGETHRCCLLDSASLRRIGAVRIARVVAPIAQREVAGPVSSNARWTITVYQPCLGKYRIFTKGLKSLFERPTLRYTTPNGSITTISRLVDVLKFWAGSVTSNRRHSFGAGRSDPANTLTVHGDHYATVHRAIMAESLQDLFRP